MILVHIYIKVREDSPGNLSSWYRHISKGGWPFSTPDNGWPVSDCTAEGLKVASIDFPIIHYVKKLEHGD